MPTGFNWSLGRSIITYIDLCEQTSDAHLYKIYIGGGYLLSIHVRRCICQIKYSKLTKSD